MVNKNTHSAIEQAFIHEIAALEIQHRRCVVGVSSGVDSMTLLALFVKYELSPVVVHINYHLRGQDSDEDEKLVSTYCHSHGIPFYVFHFCKQQDCQKGESLQMAARRFRYEKFNDVKQQVGAAYIALAHHLDDLIETFILHLSRGAGLRGLVQPDEDPVLIRPLKRVSKGEIRNYALMQGIPWREDLSNNSDTYERNRIRNIILPQLYMVHPRVSSGIQHTLENLRSAYLYLHGQTLEYIGMHKSGVYGGYKIALAPLYPWKEEYRALLHEMMLTEKLPIPNLDDFSASFHSSETKVWHVGYPLVFSRSNELFVYPDEHRTSKINLIKPWQNLQHPCELEGWGSVYRTESDADIWLSPNFEKEDICFRPWETHDSISLRDGGRKRVSAVLKDKKFNIVQRNKSLVMTVNGQVAWIVGVQADPKYITMPGKGIGIKAESGWLK